VGDQILTTSIGGGLLIALFGIVVKLMLRADTVQREAVVDVREDRDDCTRRLDEERAARIEDRRNCDEQLAKLRAANQALEVRVAVLEAGGAHHHDGDGR